MKKFLTNLKNLINILPALSLLVLLTSCSKEPVNIEDHINAENFVFLTTIAPVTTSAGDETETTTAPEEDDSLRFEPANTGVVVYAGENRIQEIDLGYTPVTDDIRSEDYNFDGYPDIFIPYDLSTSDLGIFYCFDSETETFILSDSLNYVGHLLTTTENQTLIEEIVDNDDYYDQYAEFAWKDGLLTQIRRKVCYTSNVDGQRYEETYEYDENGYEYFAGYEIVDQTEPETDS